MPHHTHISWNNTNVEFAIGFGTQLSILRHGHNDPIITLSLGPNAIAQLSDTEIVDLCRWFQGHSNELRIIEGVRENGYYDPNDELDLVMVARTTDHDGIRDQALRIIQFYQEQEGRVVEQAQPSQPALYPGYVYVVEGGGYYKIGLSNDVDRRLTQLAVQPPFELTVIHIIETDDMFGLEAELHEVFTDKRVRGEWFELDEEDIEWLLTTYEGARHD